jgi:hypothetical protein
VTIEVILGDELFEGEVFEGWEVALLDGHHDVGGGSSCREKAMLPVPLPLLQRSAKQRELFQHAGTFLIQLTKKLSPLLLQGLSCRFSKFLEIDRNITNSLREGSLKVGFSDVMCCFAPHRYALAGFDL